MSILTSGGSYLDLPNVEADGVVSACWWVLIASALGGDDYQNGYRFSDETAGLGGAVGYETSSNYYPPTGVAYFMGEDPPGTSTGAVSLPADYIGDWVFCGAVWRISSFPGSLDFCYRSQREAILHVASVPIISSTPSVLYALSDRGGGIVQSGGMITAIKAWSAQLSIEQMLQESTQNSPIVTSGLHSYLSCLPGSTIGQDQSGNGNDWNVTGGGLSLVAALPDMRLSAPTMMGGPPSL